MSKIDFMRLLNVFASNLVFFTSANNLISGLAIATVQTQYDYVENQRKSSLGAHKNSLLRELIFESRKVNVL